MLVLTGGAEDPAQKDPACGLDRLGDLVGQQVDQIEIPGDIMHRILRPGMPMTRDFRPMRLNILVDDQGLVTEAYCG
ncbi:I78 family peptidase inhibitor [Paracoccus sp. DMF-8]|uniref:I78 family peptidase inhibitor n=1 Tax=Paracoccus sp. DMF-8 TaxID=3019445 RepID=UPI0023E7C2CD|nr:I78 family peptidase inhibitor [Paracoccus sp. DMF-8]MDF3605937.1 I78 family peptidase inhibitor [Paracoccus sp. DMF-8]